MIFLVLVFAGVGFYLFLNSNNPKTTPGTNNGGQAVQNGDISGNPSTPTGGEKYVEHSQNALESARSKRRVLFFYANWCPTCRPVDSEIRSRLSDIPEDVVVIRVNYNDNETDQNEEALAEKYGVTYQHTFVIIDENDNEIKKWNGGGLDRIISELGL